MKPLHLKFCGINSFSEQAEIDFEQLTKNGLFGIFGDTGSGKSTILDAINFALYGDVERSKEKSELINYRSQSAEVEFTFESNEQGKRIVYFIERVLKKDKSGTHKAKLFYNDGEKEECIADKPQTVREKIVEILGVDQDDFRKCIAIPQGEFSEFVKATTGDRLKLIERLFNLRRYGDGLKSKINSRLNEIDIEFNNLKGQLEVYNQDNAENLKFAQDEKKVKESQLSALKKLSDERAKKYDAIKSLHEKWLELKEKEELLATLNKKSREMADLKRDLSLLESCRKIVENQTAKHKTLEDIKKYEQDLRVLKERKEFNSERFKKLKIELETGDFDAKISQLNEKKVKFSTLKGKPERLQKLADELSKMRGEYKLCDDAIKQNTVELQNVSGQISELENKFKETADTDINSLINIYFKNAILRDEYVRELDWVVELKTKAKRQEDDSPLYELLSVELDKKIQIYREKLNLLSEYSFVLANQKLNELSDFNTQKDNLSEKLSKFKTRQAEVQKNIEHIKERLAEHKKSGMELKARYDELKEEIVAVLDGETDLQKANNNVELQIDRLIKQKQNLSDSLDAVNNEISKLDLSIIELDTLKQTAKKRIEELEVEEMKALDAIGLSRESCLALVEKYRSYGNVQDSLSEYEKAHYSTLQAVETLKKIKGIDEVSDEKLAEIEHLKNTALQNYNDESGNLRVLCEQISQLEKRLEEKKRIEKEFSSVEERRNLVCQLKELTKNNKFLEFVANEYLCDISSLASKTLINLTDGRYYLVYTNGNFSVCDNYDSGNLRGVNTLSGGETFLVSLSLAISLSQTICAKSLKSIEFFFLDEGFGTLDSNLIDTVMTALEKLKSSSFTIGVISHVEELKHRIDCKITVNKATENRGSTVQMSF